MSFVAELLLFSIDKSSAWVLFGFFRLSTKLLLVKLLVLSSSSSSLLPTYLSFLYLLL